MLESVEFTYHVFATQNEDLLNLKYDFYNLLKTFPCNNFEV